MRATAVHVPLWGIAIHYVSKHQHDLQILHVEHFQILPTWNGPI
jgi:hypothetical protein